MEVARDDRLVVPVFLNPIGVVLLAAVARVVEEQRVAALRVAHEPA